MAGTTVDAHPERYDTPAQAERVEGMSFADHLHEAAQHHHQAASHLDRAASQLDVAHGVVDDGSGDSDAAMDDGGGSPNRAMPPASAQARSFSFPAGSGAARSLSALTRGRR